MKKALLGLSIGILMGVVLLLDGCGTAQQAADTDADIEAIKINMNGLIETITGDPDNMRPTLLEESSADIQEEQDDFQRVVGKLWALSRIADKKSCSKAKQDFPEGARGLIAVAIEDTYRTLSAPFGGVPRPCDNKSLGTGAQEFAKARLLGLKLNKD